MFGLAFLFLIVAGISSLFSFGVIEDIHSLTAQIIFAVSLLLFVLCAFAGFKPSQQLRVPQ